MEKKIKLILQEFDMEHTFDTIANLDKNKWNSIVKKAAMQLEIANIK